MKSSPYLLVILFLILPKLPNYGCTPQPENVKQAILLSDLGDFGMNLSFIDDFLYKHPDSSEYYLNQAEHHLDSVCKIEHMLFLYFKSKVLYNNFENKKHIQEIAKRGLELADELNYTYYQYKLNQVLGVVNSDRLNIAQTHYSRAYQLCKLLDSDQDMIHILTNLINFGVLQKELNLASLYTDELGRLLRIGEPNTEYTISHIRYYTFKAQLSEELSSAILYADSALYITDILNLKSIRQNIFVLKSTIYEKHQKYLNAILLFDQAEAYAKTIGRKDLIIQNYLRKAYLYTQLKDYTNAKHYFERHNASEFSTHRSKRFNYNKLGFDIYEGLNDNKTAIVYLKKYLGELEQVLTQREDSIYVEFENRYKIDRTQNQLILNEEKIKRQQLERKYSIIFMIILLVIVILIYRWRSIYNKQQLESTKKILKNVNYINDFRTRFIENVTHEVRTPLTLINGAFETVLSYDIENKYKGILHIGYQNSKRLNIEMENMLNLIRAESIIDILDLKDVHVLTFFTNVFDNYKLNIFSKGLTLKFKHNLKEDTIARIDSGKVTTILLNYLNNAIKHSKEDEIIEVQVKASLGTLFFSVTDFGQGISLEDLPFIFDRNYHTKQSSRTYRGIELSIVKEVANILKGEVSVNSTSSDKGPTEFTFQQTCVINTFNPEETTIEYHTDQIKTSPFTALNKNPKILVIDDSELMIEFYKQIFSEHYICDYAFDGKRALEKISTEQYDCIVTDVIMPEMDGFELVKQLQKMEDTKHLPIIFVTADTLDEHRVKAFRTGVHDYITKPFIVQELIARIDNLIKNRSSKTKPPQNGVLGSLKVDLTNAEYHTDDDLLKKIIQIINENISNVNFKVSDLATSVFYSERQLARKINMMTGLTPSKLILEIRLLKAYSILKESKSIRILDVQNSIGIKSSAYFNKAFKERFGITPSSLQKNV